ncbi:MAG TPA: ComEC/Rec2 family competence protein [Anaerolineales bacterium]|nr:ComEC/Rec2 family competence protein [Anaerolineales bacterium]
MTLPLLWISLALMGGMALASVIQVHVVIWAILMLLTLTTIYPASRILPAEVSFQVRRIQVSISRRSMLLGVLCLAGAFFGALRYQSNVPGPTADQIGSHNDAGYDVLVTGTLREPPDVRDTYTNLRLQVTQLDEGRGPVAVKGVVLARVPPGQDLQYGDNVRLRGRLLTPPSNEDFSYRDYLARQGIRSYMPSAIATQLPGHAGSPFLRLVFAWKQLSLRNVYRLFLDPEASLLAGILLGVDTGLPERVRQAFNNTGTAHIIAISGFNIAVIAGVMAFAFNRLLGVRLGAIAAGAGILLYTLFVGGDPPVMRAALMGLVGLFAVQIGRRQVGINTLAFVSGIMALINPLILWDVGFQLSVMATLGLILYGTRFTQAVRGLVEHRLPPSGARNFISALFEFVALTLAAEVTTLPIVAYHFKQISLVSPIVNALVLPVQPAVMVIGGAAVLLSLIFFPLGQLLAWVAWPLTAYTIRLVELFDALPHAVVYLDRFSLAVVVLFYAVLLGVTLAGSRMMEYLRSLKPRLAQLGLGAALVVMLAMGWFIWRVVVAAPDGRLHVSFLDVGSADAIFIQGPTGSRVLINSGPSAVAVSDALGRRMSPLHHDLDWLVVAAADEEEVAALPALLPRFPPKEVLFGAPEQGSFSSGALMERLDADRTPTTHAEVGQALNLGRGASLKVVDVSTRGSTLLLEWNSFRMLLPVGANLDTLQALQSGQSIGPVSVLLLAQSGYAPLLTPEWVQNLNPRLVVISVAAADKDGLPPVETLEILKDHSILRTDVNGWIDISTDGSRMWVSSERNSQ